MFLGKLFDNIGPSYVQDGPCHKQPQCLTDLITIYIGSWVFIVGALLCLGVRMIQWSTIGNSFATFLHESKASEEAKKRGLVPSKRRGYYEDPAKPGVVVAKSERGGTRLAAVKPKAAPKKRTVAPPKAKRPTVRKKVAKARA
ncbi:hypothetical protein LCGC14_1075150, partial [marine sediment metagenome]